MPYWQLLCSTLGSPVAHHYDYDVLVFHPLFSLQYFVKDVFHQVVSLASMLGEYTVLVQLYIKLYTCILKKILQSLSISLFPFSFQITEQLMLCLSSSVLHCTGERRYLFQSTAAIQSCTSPVCIFNRPEPDHLHPECLMPEFLIVERVFSHIVSYISSVFPLLYMIAIQHSYVTTSPSLLWNWQ